MYKFVALLVLLHGGSPGYHLLHHLAVSPAVGGAFLIFNLVRQGVETVGTVYLARVVYVKLKA